MIIIKTPDQIEGIRKSCILLAHVMKELGEIIQPGISTWEIDQKAEQLIIEGGGKPAFKGYRGGPGGIPFPSSVCASVNDIVVHGPAISKEPLKEGEIIGIDCGINLDGYYSDMAMTFPVGKIEPSVQNLLDVTKQSLMNGIDKVKPGNKIEDISQAIQNTVTPHGYGIVHGFAGHGVGVDVHEDPWIPNYVSNEMRDSLAMEIKPGHVYAIEPMITTGGNQVSVQGDGWSVKTNDNSLSAHFEHTVLVTEDGHEILTL